MELKRPSPEVFQLLYSVKINEIVKLGNVSFEPFIPALYRLDRQRLQLMEPMYVDLHQVVVSSIRSRKLKHISSLDFSMMSEDIMRELSLLRKSDGVPVNNRSLADYELAGWFTRARIVLSFISSLVYQVKECTKPFSHIADELLDCPLYTEDVVDVLIFCFAELPALLDVKDVCEALLRLNLGLVVILHLVANMPVLITSVCAALVSNSRCSDDESSLEYRARARTLRELCRLYPPMVTSTCRLLLLKKSMTSLAFDLCLYGHGEPTVESVLMVMAGTSSQGSLGAQSDTLLKLLPDENCHAVQLLHRYIGAQLKSYSAALSHPVTSSLTTADLVFHDTLFVPATRDLDYAKITLFTKLLCRLQCLGLVLTAEESAQLVQLVTSQTVLSSHGAQRFAAVGLCTLLACSFLISTPELEQKVLEWLQLLQQCEAGTISAGTENTFGDLLLLIAIHFACSQTEAIVDLVSSNLGFPVRLGALTRIRLVFVQELYPEKAIAEHVLKIPVTRGLSSDHSGFLPIRCVHQLLQSRAFTRHCSDVKDWMFRQLCGCVMPLHDQVVSLLETYVGLLITTYFSTKAGKQSKTHLIQGFDEQAIISVFTETSMEDISCQTTTRLCLLLYVLLYQDSYLNNIKNFASILNRPPLISPKLWAVIPVKSLLLLAEHHRDRLGRMYPYLLSLTITHHPHLCLPDSELLMESFKDQLREPITVSRSQLQRIQLLPVIKESAENPYRAMRLVWLEQLAPEDLEVFSEDLVASLVHLLDNRVPRRVQMLCANLWKKLNVIMPDRLWLMTATSLISKEISPPVCLTAEDIKQNPLLLLKCDQQVFRCPPVLDILLITLAGYVSASRVFVQQTLLLKSGLTGSSGILSDAERDELRLALLQTQECAIIQIMLEACLENEEDRKCQGPLSNCLLTEVRCLVCCYLHQMFISDPTLAKLVHFQGYPSELIPVLVAGVPSMHLCLAYLPELFNLPQLDKQMFAILVASYIALEYPLSKAMMICSTAISRLSALLGALSYQERPEFYIPTLPCLVRFCHAFPPLRESCIEVLLAVQKVVNRSVEQIPSCEDLLGSKLHPDLGMCEEGYRHHEPLLDASCSYQQLQEVIRTTLDAILETTVVKKAFG